MKETTTRLKTNSSSSSPNPAANSTANAFKFWACFTFGISLFTLIILTLSALTPQDDESWFSSLPTDLKHHYSKGRMIKVQKSPYNAFPFQVFATENDSPRNEGEQSVLLIHGFCANSYSFRNVIKSLGLNEIHAVGIDLPGSGFSDKSEFVVEYERFCGISGWFYDIYSDLRKRGWFDQLVGIPSYEDETGTQTSRTLTKILKPMDLDSEDVGTIIGQVIDSLDLSSPVHIVLHDFALVMCGSWISWNLELVRSITLIDSTPASTALPIRMLEMSVVRDVVLGFSSAYQGLLRNCCSRSVNKTVAEAHRVLLTGRDDRRGALLELRKVEKVWMAQHWWL
ncbi:protein AUXIN RESPONSE 4-like [Papaver somniferum]|uniref:protein AUXIN RESPONSE 4-like n=1 Tax=Papaver somniferum TaxID=3469 RepID=UPI000E701509|nr:protein AUXIN RESPONSE 4-like [Papaver somniferum]